MRERVLRIGKPQVLATIATLPEKIDTDRPAVIIVNSGVMHHIGTCRMSVKIARGLAAEGHLALRFDFSGIGDSVPRTGTRSFAESAFLEITEVMDFLEKSKGISRFILMGLCSGADAVYEAALRDSRVTGLCQIDPYCYRTPKWKLHYWLPRILSTNHWRMVIKYRTGQMSARSNEDLSEDNVEMPSYIRDFPPREQVRDGLATLVERGSPVYAIFTNGQPEHFNYQGQFEESMSDLDFKGLLQTSYHPKCNHIIAEPDQQKQILESIVSWTDGVVRRLESKNPQPLRAVRSVVNAA